MIFVLDCTLYEFNNYWMRVFYVRNNQGRVVIDSSSHNANLKTVLLYTDFKENGH